MKRRLLFVALVAACVDPLHDEEIAAQGPEVAGVPEGPNHRPGSPCTLCHGERGPAEPEISVGGTVFLAPDSDAGASGAIVTVTDARDAGLTRTTNEVGSFYVTKAEYDPVYPLTVNVAYQGKTAKMTALIRRDGGCGRCHRLNGDASHVRRVYVAGPP